MEKVQKQIIFFVAGFLLLVTSSAQAATLYLSPSAGSYTVGQSFPLSVYVLSPEQAMNAVSGIVFFPQEKLEVVSLSKTGSIMNLWVLEPSFSNSTGLINFEGIVLNPGFTGEAGKIITINLKVKGAGIAPVIFSSGSVLANDGLGTNILKGLGNASFKLNLAEVVEKTGVPLAAKITSPTHPDPEKWYSDSNPKFTWLISPEIIASRVLYDKYPASSPTILYTPAISEKELKNVKDGIWYLHVQLRNANGWGAISHFRSQIDTEKPNFFEIKEVKREDLTELRVKFIFEASDALSGIDYYEVRIDDRDLLVWRDDGSHIYETPTLIFGKHLLITKAVDKAGNALANSLDFNIEALEPPKIIEYPQKLQSGEPLIVKGITYPNSRVTIWLQGENEEAKSQIIKSGEKGNFTFIAKEKLKEGIFQLWAEVTDERGAKSGPSEKITFVVSLPTFLRFGEIVLNYLTIIITLLILIVGALVIIFYSWYRIFLWRKKVRKEIKETEESLHSAFNILKKEIEEQIAKLDGEPGLSERENKICDELKEALETSEKTIGKEIKEIEEELK